MMNLYTLVATLAIVLNLIETSSGTEPRTRDFLANFGKSNEHANQQDSSSSNIYGAGLSWPTPHGNNLHSTTAPIIIYYKGRNIEVSFHMISGHPTPTDCKVLGPHPGVPTIQIKEHINYVTRALMYGGKRYCVVYETGNGKVLGAKLPPVLGPLSYTGDPYDLNPDESKCYITYGGLDFVVNANPETRNPLNIKLLPHNLTPNQSYMYRYAVNIIPVHFGGLYFLIYQRTEVNGKRDVKIVGADLDPNWRHKLPNISYG